MPDLALNPLPLKDPQGGTLSLTRASGIGAAIVALLTTINDSWNTIFGADTPSWAKPVFLMVVVGAWSAIAAADLLARGYKAGQQAAAKGGLQVIPMPPLEATDTRREDEACTVAGARFDPAKPGDPAFLVIKKEGTSEWVSHSDLKFKAVSGAGEDRSAPRR